MTDTERLDWLAEYVNEHGALVLHDGEQETGQHSGLGLRPGNLNRTLREAIDSAQGVASARKAFPHLSITGTDSVAVEMRLDAACDRAETAVPELRRCEHERLDMDGICLRCGADRRGI